MHVLSFSRSPALRPALFLALIAAAFAAAPAAARADDLIQLNGDPPVTLSGGVSYGLLYLDGTVRLAGDTAISAQDVFIGPDASLQTCYDVATDGNNCTNGRSLSINASGGVSISPAIDLRGAIGTNRAGGSLAIGAAHIALGGGVETAGTAAPSGSITINSGGLVVTQNLHAPGASITVHGAGGVQIGGDVGSAGDGTATGSDASRTTSGGPVDIASSGGDVSVLGSIASWGRDMTAAGALMGGNGAPVSVSGGNVQISGGIDSSAGRGVDQSAGSPGAIALAARGSLLVSGSVTASGDSSTSGNASDGAPISMSAGAALTAGSINSQGGASTNLGAGAGGNITLTAGAALGVGAINDAGAGGPTGGRHGGAVAATGATVSLGSVTADAGDATSAPANGSGEGGGSVTIKATSNVGVGSLSARGGSGQGLGGGGPGGSVSITGDHVATGSISVFGENLSAAGGKVTLAAQSGLLVGGAVDASGANGGNASPGGSGGPITLTSPHGPLTLAGRLRSEGGSGASGGAAGANGGSGGPVTMVVQSIAASNGVLTGGGNGGNSGVQNGPQGVGGNGGKVQVWAQLPSMILLQLVDTSGGDGSPNGSDGAQMDEAAPSAVSISKASPHMLAFTSNAPDADGYRLLASLAGAPAKVVLTTKTSGVAVPKVAACVKTDYTVVGFDNGVGWQSDPVGPITVTEPPSNTQACTDAPQLTLGVQKLVKKIKALKKKKWHVTVHFLADGMGTANIALSRKGKTLYKGSKALGATRRNVTMTITIPKKLRKAGKFLVTVKGSAPIGKAVSKSSLTLEVTK